ncbi:unnamed protein product [Caenorhabditis angaria]|uniref:Tetratricopeptide repeat protein 26 n=1 Tax=Caenorhabditis angaria TaxID=860376 RepID=A0A9P1IBU0_9PELO|nr:unnamed protein product [Caenorhabditis angaria]
MLLSRLRSNRKKSNAASSSQPRKVQKMPELEEFLMKKDYQGAISLLEFKAKESPEWDEARSLWLGHCYFHAGEYRKAADIYEPMLEREECPPDASLFLGCCYFFLGMYPEARATAEKAPKSPLFVRLMFHLAHKTGDEKRLMTFHQQLSENLEDQLSLASIHYLRMHYADAVEVYKNILTSQPSLIALNVYMAMCYYKMDYFDVAQDVLAVYLQAFPESPAAQNLAACIRYKSWSGKSALPGVENLMKTNLYPSAREIIRHNQVVFNCGDGALQVWPNQVNDAMSLCNELEPHLPYEFLVKAITFTLHGYIKESKDHLKTAEQFFKMVGESTAECDTIPGRLSMASSLFLQQKYDEVIVYLDSVREYHQESDVYLLNIAQARLACRHYKEAEEAFLRVTGPERDQPLYKFMLARSFIYNQKPHYAWDIMTKTRNTKDAASLMKLIAHDCYKAGEYYYSVKAFAQLEKSDPSPENWQGKRGATAGLFRLFVHGKAPKEQMAEALGYVAQTHHSHAEFLSYVIKNWAKSHSINFDK